MQDVAHPDELGQGLSSHLAHDLPTVDLDGHLAHAEIAGDLLVHPPKDHERHDLALARRERGKALPQVIQDGALPDVLLDWPNDVGVSPTGDLWVVDTFNQRLRVAPALATSRAAPTTSN